jgi:hypothetical protein
MLSSIPANEGVYLGKPSIEKTRYNLEIFQIGEGVVFVYV